MTASDATRRYIVAITGATGAVFGIRLLERLREFPVETHLVLSPWGARTVTHETGMATSAVGELADVVHRAGDQAATISSGSFTTDGMVVAPCSVKTLAAIASGFAGDLVARAADVTLKERRPLVLMVRESPFNEVHLENMLRLARMGVSIMPPVPAFYNHPETVDDIVDHVVTRTLDQLGLYSDRTPRWDGRMGSTDTVDENGS